MTKRHDMMAGRLDPVRRLLLRLDRQLQTRLFDRLASGSGAAGSEGGMAVTPVTGLLLDLLAGRRQEHARRLWTDWFEPVLQRDLALLATTRHLPGCLHIIDLSAFWAALSRRISETVSDIQDAAIAMARTMPLDRVLSSEEAAGWAETLRRKTLSELQSLRRSPARLAAFLSVANAERAGLTARLPIRMRPLDEADLDDLVAILANAHSLRLFSRSAPSLKPDALLREVADALDSGTVALEAIALYAVAGLHGSRAAPLQIRLPSLLPVPLVEDAVAAQRLEIAAGGWPVEAMTGEQPGHQSAPVRGIALCGTIPAPPRPLAMDLSADDVEVIGRSLTLIAAALSGPAETGAASEPPARSEQ